MFNIQRLGNGEKSDARGRGQSYHQLISFINACKRSLELSVYFTWLPNTPMAVAVETSLGPNHTAASRAGRPRMNTWATEQIACAIISSQNLSGDTAAHFSHAPTTQAGTLVTWFYEYMYMGAAHGITGNANLANSMMPHSGEIFKVPNKSIVSCSAIICQWLDSGLPPRFPQVLWRHWGKIEPFPATLAESRLAVWKIPWNTLPGPGVEPGPRRGQPVRYIHSPNEPSWLIKIPKHRFLHP